MTSQHDDERPMVDPSELVPTAAAARLAGLDPSYVRRLCRKGQVQGAIQQPNGAWLVPTQWVSDRIAAGNETAPASWELERDFMHAERAELIRNLLEQRVTALEQQLAAAHAENDRLRQVAAGLVAAANAAIAGQARAVAE